MSDFLSMQTPFAEMAWPAAIALAWLCGEAGNRWLHLPRISVYGLVGFLISGHQGGFLVVDAKDAETIAPQIANYAFALMLFELGYRINFRWLRNNQWIGATALVEAAGTFVAIYLLASAFALSQTTSLFLAALAMATSPAAVLRTINDTRSAGQVTERLLHLTALNCIAAVVVFKIVLGYSLLEAAGQPFQAAWNSLVVLTVSIGLGCLFGVGVAGLLRWLGGHERNATLAFAAFLLLLTAVTHELKFSPLVAALAFGAVARHRRIALTQAQRNFGALGDLLTVFLFVYVAASLAWAQVQSALWLAVCVIAIRFVVKTATTSVFAAASGITLRKGFLTGVGMMPMSVFALLLMEQTRHLDVAVLNQLAGLSAIVLLLEIFGPIVTQTALRLAGEADESERR